MSTTTKQSRTILRSDELTCPSCVRKIEKTLRAVPGVSTATVHFTAGRIEVELWPGWSLTPTEAVAVPPPSAPPGEMMASGRRCRKRAAGVD